MSQTNLFEFLQGLAFTPLPHRFDDPAASDCLLILGAAGLVDVAIESRQPGLAATVHRISDHGNEVLQRYGTDPNADPDTLLGIGLPGWCQRAKPENRIPPTHVPLA